MNKKIKIKIVGKNPKYFIKEMIKQKIAIYKLEMVDNQAIVIIKEDDYEKILKWKSKYQLQIINYYGYRKIIMILKKYQNAFIFLILGIILNIFLSNVIWNIEINHSNKKIQKLIIDDLNEFGIKKYHLKVNYKKKEKIKKEILKKEKDKIEWLEIEEIGTKYIVHVEIRKKQKKEKECFPRNLISRKNAIIMEINASSGEVMKKKNDYIEKGEVIISGDIYNKEDIVSTRCATGKVYGETWYKVVVIVPEKIKIKKILKNKKYGIYINYLKNKIYFPKKLSKNKNIEYNILNSKILPLNISIIKSYEVDLQNKKYTIKNIDNHASKLAIRKIKAKNKYILKILSKKVLKKKLKNSKIEVEVFLRVKEDITDYKKIIKNELEKIE